MNNAQLLNAGIPDLHEDAFQPIGRSMRLYGGGGKGSAPKPADPPPPPRPQYAEEQQVMDATRQKERQRLAAAQGQASTMITGGQGLSDTASTASKTLLGQ
jgi:hypothetical protein